ncbi:hypothetical protein STVA_11780 [Allostella vacuolata]|nr:hypothetical protein STVA_11780 [Stella vacuolata]
MAHRVLNPFPKYLQIRDILRTRLERGAAVGDQLPTEHALCEEFGVSRETIRDALLGLETEGLVSRRRGQGTFVIKLPPPRSERRLTGLTEDFSALKLDTEARVLERGLALPPPIVAEIMGVAADEMVYRITRLRLFSRDHFAHHDAFLPLEIGARIARLDLSRTSMMHELRETLGLDIWEDHQRIEATVADGDMAALLRVPAGAPLLCITRHFLTGEDQTVVVFRSHFRADRYYYTVKLSQGKSEPHARAAPTARRAKSPRAKSSRAPRAPAGDADPGRFGRPAPQRIHA